MKPSPQRPISIGFQSRIDLWDEAGMDLLARAHTVSFECGIESITEEGRDEMNKNCRMTTDRISELLIYARQGASPGSRPTSSKPSTTTPPSSPPGKPA